ncbi:hypothetical protein FFLO_05071 [Filobasidium floriforme]|uniref:Phytanoyl-CoA dioxygenase n=1 Tax=Filobasidium floriforme TaxID=5210 RepID=A0A8K0JHJ0_9TREE|nr:uncharacterized protein HD553DRAFT_144489 [Filobasidium floriforme]KAG7530408.1 hypothetical protein FFLO_05071 [Filobasidium floriforme]KAH8078695.1 hypothetical protein HD553DRAFT_144489 [Filobasidium floriforme]
MDHQPLTPEQIEHFVQHGWLKIPNAIDKKYLELWMSNLWTRLGWDKDAKSTWTDEYVKMPRHREVPVEELSPKAWQAACELVGGEDKIDPIRERYHGDQMICNFGTEHWTKNDFTPQQATGWHHDNDWYRQFLDSSGNAITVIHCFTDIPPRGGGTYLCEDGLANICQTLLDHPEGFEPPLDLYSHIPNCKKFVTVEAKAGDVFLLHGLLPHTNSKNHLRYARVIANPHINMVEPFNLNRVDGAYTPCEKVILRALGRESIPEYRPIRERQAYFPRTATFKRARIDAELERMIAAAAAEGLGRDSVDSIYLKGEEAIREHERRAGYDLAHGPGGIAHTIDDTERVTAE